MPDFVALDALLRRVIFGADSGGEGAGGRGKGESRGREEEGAADEEEDVGYEDVSALLLCLPSLCGAAGKAKGPAAAAGAGASAGSGVGVVMRDTKEQEEEEEKEDEDQEEIAGAGESKVAEDRAWPEEGAGAVGGAQGGANLLLEALERQLCRIEEDGGKASADRRDRVYLFLAFWLSQPFAVADFLSPGLRQRVWDMLPPVAPTDEKAAPQAPPSATRKPKPPDVEGADAAGAAASVGTATAAAAATAAGSASGGGPKSMAARKLFVRLQEVDALAENVLAARTVRRARAQEEERRLEEERLSQLADALAAEETAHSPTISDDDEAEADDNEEENGGAAEGEDEHEKTEAGTGAGQMTTALALSNGGEEVAHRAAAPKSRQARPRRQQPQTRSTSVLSPSRSAALASTSDPLSPGGPAGPPGRRTQSVDAKVRLLLMREPMHAETLVSLPLLFPPDVLAELLTVMEFEEGLTKIVGREFIGRGWADPARKVANSREGGANGLAEWVDAVNRRIALFASETIQYTSVSGPTKTALEYFIETALECICRNNFNSAFQIVSGLSIPAVKRLKNGWQDLSDEHREWFVYMRDRLFCTDQNYHLYRRAMAERFREPHIPILPVFLHDITSLDERELWTRPGGEKTTIKHTESNGVAGTAGAAAGAPVEEEPEQEPEQERTNVPTSSATVSVSDNAVLMNMRKARTVHTAVREFLAVATGRYGYPVVTEPLDLTRRYNTRRRRSASHSGHGRPNSAAAKILAFCLPTPPAPHLPAAPRDVAWPIDATRFAKPNPHLQRNGILPGADRDRFALRSDLRALEIISEKTHRVEPDMHILWEESKRVGQAEKERLMSKLQSFGYL